MSLNEFHCERIFLLGGVIINTSEEYNDYVDIRNFDVIETKSLEPFKPKSILELDAFKNL
jgi:maleate cis-trans isomerase